MQKPRLILPQRRRRIPPQFSWVDHRLVREQHVCGRSAHALALYLFLVTVANADGLSWYSDPSLCRWLSWTPQQLAAARAELQHADLIAYRPPLYQVLDLTPRAAAGVRGTADVRGGEAVSIGEILRQLGGATR